MISQSELIELNKLEPKFERGDAVLLDSTSCVVLSANVVTDLRPANSSYTFS